MPTEPNTQINSEVVTERTAFKPTGAPFRETVVTFRVGDHGPFQFIVPTSEFTIEKAKAAMQAKQRDIRALVTP